MTAKFQSHYEELGLTKEELLASYTKGIQLAHEEIIPFPAGIMKMLNAKTSNTARKFCKSWGIKVHTVGRKPPQGEPPVCGPPADV